MSKSPLLDLVHGVPPVSISSTSTRDNRTGSWKYIRPVYRDKVAPCNEGCPVGIDIEGYMNLLREERVDEAIDLLLRENPMPATTGRVCYHPCEIACNRRSFDEPVSIHAVERILGDLALDAPLPPATKPTRSERVAVVGSGPAGLACAYHLARLGYAVTVYEAAPEPGGVLRVGIPEYRLPKDVLAKEIARIAAVGVEIECNQRIGLDVPWSELDEYDAVFAATGVHRSQPLRLPEDHPSVRPGLKFLREVNFGERPDLGSRVVVVGGGNTAMDCARTALRLGSHPVVLYRRTRVEMPAIDEEVVEAEEEGVEFHFLAAPVALRIEADRLQGLECVRMQLGEADESGRRRPVPIEGSEFFLPADSVLTAIGEAPEFETWSDDIERDDWVIKTGPFGESSRPGFFAGGDIVDLPHTVADALGSGKRAAIGIDRYLRAKAGESVEASLDQLRYGRIGNASMTRWRADDPILRHDPVNDVVPYEQLNVEHFLPVPKHRDRHLDPQKRRKTFHEVNVGLGEQGLAEAVRCFNCGVCNLCELCLIFCPDIAIHRRGDGQGFSIDYDHCKGCGLCDAECPRGAMAMTREGL